LWRICHGFAFGAALAVGAALIAEYATPDRRGRAMGLLQSTYAIGWALSTAAYLILFESMNDEQAWRYLFLLGILPAIAALQRGPRTGCPGSRIHRHHSRFDRTRHLDRDRRLLRLRARDHVCVAPPGDARQGHRRGDQPHVRAVCESGYLMNRISEYFGSGQRSSATTFSS
jgi:hypothetical protein